MSSAGQWFDFRAGHIYIIPAWVLFNCRCDRPVGHLYLHFDVMNLPAEHVAEHFQTPLDLGSPPALSSLLDELRGSPGEQEMALPSALCLAKAAIFAALGKVLGSLQTSAQRKLLATLEPGHRLQAALSHVEQHLHAPISNDDLADACGVSAAQLCRLFQALLGQSPARYVQDRRIARAAQALAFTDQSIDQIALAHGFPDRFYFSRVFRRKMGLPPAAYRRQEVV